MPGRRFCVLQARACVNDCTTYTPTLKCYEGCRDEQLRCFDRKGIRSRPTMALSLDYVQLVNDVLRQQRDTHAAMVAIMQAALQAQTPGLPIGPPHWDSQSRGCPVGCQVFEGQCVCDPPQGGPGTAVPGFNPTSELVSMSGGVASTRGLNASSSRVGILGRATGFGASSAGFNAG